jgi:hypothetical protein
MSLGHVIHYRSNDCGISLTAPAQKASEGLSFHHHDSG